MDNVNNEKKLSKSIQDLSDQITKKSSLKWNFLMGVFFGFGSAIGASIIAAALVAFLVHLFPELRNTPLIR